MLWITSSHMRFFPGSRLYLTAGAESMCDTSHKALFSACMVRHTFVISGGSSNGMLLRKVSVISSNVSVSTAIPISENFPPFFSKWSKVREIWGHTTLHCFRVLIHDECQFRVSGHLEVWNSALTPLAENWGFKVETLLLLAQWSIVQHQNPHEDVKERFYVISWHMVDSEVIAMKLYRSEIVLLVNTTAALQPPLKCMRDLFEKLYREKRDGALIDYQWFIERWWSAQGRSSLRKGEGDL